MTAPNSAVRLRLSGTTSKESATPRKPLRSRDLLAGYRDVRIIHGSETYYLRETRQGKLILTK